MKNIRNPRTVVGGTKAAIRSTYTGIRAAQDMNGATRMVTTRSRRFSMVRAPMMPGTAHANDDSIGMNERPESPHRLSRPSARNAARDM